MRKEWIWIIILSLMMALLIPLTVVRWIDHQGEVDPSDLKIRVLMPEGQVETLSLEEYLVGVVAAEMPATFELEALKAQAVAARTYAIKKMKNSQSVGQAYDVDTTVQTQAWISESQMRKKWGWGSYRKYHTKVKKAVQSTKGLVMVFLGEYIDAYYHSSSGRKMTERSEDVWSTARAYLKNVESGEEDPLRFVNQYKFSIEELYQKLGLTGMAQSFNSTDVQAISRTSAGRLKALRVLGRTYQASQLRTLLGLASTDIEWNISPQEIVFTTYGKGHGVGMSQYGANGLAQNGRTYDQILTHFYAGISILSLKAGS